MDLWSLELDRPPEVRHRLERTLSSGERARADRFHHEIDRSRYEVRRGLLRTILSRYLGLRPEAIELETNAFGKPRVAGREELEFSLSHSGARAILAIGAGRSVGVDLEEIRALEELDRLAESCFSTAERAALRAVPSALRLEAFHAGWTRKEAFLKALGEGLSRPLSSFDVTIAPGEPARVLRLDGDPAAASRYSMRALKVALGFVGAVAFEGPEFTLRWMTTP